jgi:TolB protein
MTYFHSPGVLELEAPVGMVSVTATHGLVAPALTTTKPVQAGATTTIDLAFSPLWDPRGQGWYSGDNHFHLNYGGVYYLTPDDLLPVMRGEDLDVAVPMTANLHNRLMDSEWIGWTRYELPAVVFGQEVRSHFLGHVGLFDHGEWFWPWFYGPFFPVFGDIDLPNSDVLLHARRHRGINTYVHPIYTGMPFDEKNLDATPVNLVQDAVLGHIDSLEIACAWINAIGTSELWYRLLNIGAAIVPNAGSDTFPNYYRNLVFGGSRLYVKLDGAFSWSRYTEALRQGRSFATNGPLLDFQVSGHAPGSIVQATGKVDWSLVVYTPVEIGHAEIVVNGDVVFSAPGPLAPGRHAFRGTVKAPRGGWIAARAWGGKVVWPVMDSLPFAHAAPIWFGRVGSTEAGARRRAAVDLQRVLDFAERAIGEAYKGASIPRIRAERAEARRRLLDMQNSAK